MIVKYESKINANKMKGFRIKKSDYVVANLNVQSVYNPHTFRPLVTILVTDSEEYLMLSPD